jgi:hypothetical protein
MNDPARAAPAGTRRQDTTVEKDGIVSDEDFAVFLGEVEAPSTQQMRVCWYCGRVKRVWIWPMEDGIGGDGG